MATKSLHDLSGLLDDVYDQLQPWATFNGYRTLTSAFVLGRSQDLDIHAHLMSTGGLPLGWDVMSTAAVHGTHYLLVRTDKGWWTLMCVENTLSLMGTTLRLITCEKSLGMLADHILGTHLGNTSTLLHEELRLLLSSYPLREDEETEQMLSALGGGVYVPWSAY